MTRTYGFLSTYPPTHCGLATFTSALAHHLAATLPGSVGRVVRVLREADLERDAGGPVVVHRMSPGAVEGAADALNLCDVALVQHEFDIYGGVDGDDVLGVLARLRVPVIAVLHTVVVEPTPGQRRVLDEVVARADVVVTMSEVAARRLVDGYAVERPAKVVVIQHGAVPGGPVTPRVVGDRPLILTWGLLRRGKGIEWAVSAMGRLRELRPRYLVAGRTHPRVLAREGEIYRTNLCNRAVAVGVGDLVDFDPTYRDVDALAALVHQADVVLLPYDSCEQATSAVLVEALVARRPVVATEFPHATEMLSGGAGLLVPRRDPAAMAAALRRVLTEPAVAAGMSEQAGRLTPALGWPAVANRYRAVVEDLLAARVVVTT